MFQVKLKDVATLLANHILVTVAAVWAEECLPFTTIGWAFQK